MSPGLCTQFYPHHYRMRQTSYPLFPDKQNSKKTEELTQGHRQLRCTAGQAVYCTTLESTSHITSVELYICRENFSAESDFRCGIFLQFVQGYIGASNGSTR